MIHAIKATLIKETRENLRWAALILLIGGILLYSSLSTQFQVGMSILGDNFLKVCMLMYPLLGLALGMLQIFQDSRKGRWQFVSHRPMSLRLMLSCKIAVGIVLYLAATLVPLTIAVLWVKEPGHVPGPFSWDMAEPSLAYLLWGLIWYAAGMLIAARQARWFGSRLIPLGGAIAGSWACYTFSWTRDEFIVIAIAVIGVELVALLGVFRSREDATRVPIWSKPPIAISLLSGWILVLTVSMLMGDAAIREFYPEPQSTTPQKQYRWMPDGTLQIWTYGTNSNGVIRAQDLQGADMPLPPNDYWMVPTPPVANIYFHDQFSRYRTTYAAFHEGFLQPLSHAIPAGNQWFYVKSRRLFEQYDQQTRRLRISVGPEGFGLPGTITAAFPPQAEYSRNVGSENLVTSPDAVYFVDLSGPSTTKIFTASADDPVIDASSSEDANNFAKQHSENQPTYDRSPFIVVATRSALHILQDHRPPITLPIDPSLDKTNLQIVRRGSGQFSVAYGLTWSVGWGLDVLTYDQSGKLVDRIHQPKELDRNADDNINLEEVGALTLAPQGFFAFVLIVKHELASSPWHVWALPIGSCAIYTTLALLLLRRRHSNWIQLTIWLPVVAALGLTGILLMVSMLEFPRRMRCDSCRKHRLVTEHRCPNCDAAATSPAMEGIEIFEPMQSAAAG
jgi:hypothetical protein